MGTSVKMLERGDLGEVTFDLGGFSREGRRAVVTGAFNGRKVRVPRSRNGFVENRWRDNAVRFWLPTGCTNTSAATWRRRRGIPASRTATHFPAGSGNLNS
jgi:hypothetical protein